MGVCSSPHHREWDAMSACASCPCRRYVPSILCHYKHACPKRWNLCESNFARFARQQQLVPDPTYTCCTSRVVARALCPPKREIDWHVRSEKKWRVNTESRESTNCSRSLPTQLTRQPVNGCRQKSRVC